MLHALRIEWTVLLRQEEQRRVTNREMCRDELLALLREAAAVGQAFGGSAPDQKGAGNGAYD